jgi:hypothetical protein
MKYRAELIVIGGFWIEFYYIMMPKNSLNQKKMQI